MARRELRVKQKRKFVLPERPAINVKLINAQRPERSRRFSLRREEKTIGPRLDSIFAKPDKKKRRINISKIKVAHVRGKRLKSNV